jgi:D-sedoheptulose 7-phosphate isomerase
VLAGVRTAQEIGLMTIGLSKEDGEELARLVDIPIVVPLKDTARIQECYITIGHLLCEVIEADLEAGELFFAAR